jgi:hypothetical protein
VLGDLRIEPSKARTYSLMDSGVSGGAARIWPKGRSRATLSHVEVPLAPGRRENLWPPHFSPRARLLASVPPLNRAPRENSIPSAPGSGPETPADKACARKKRGRKPRKSGASSTTSQSGAVRARWDIAHSHLPTRYPIPIVRVKGFTVRHETTDLTRRALTITSLNSKSGSGATEPA